ncbi:MAG: hypothetical protein NVS2B14_18310 [Chamaesiphon sp.]
MTGTGQDLSSFSMLDLFHSEVETQAAILNDKLLALENNSDATKELESLMRAAHSIKGAARIVQLDAAVKVAHVMEDVFVVAQAGSVALGADKIDVLLQGVDWLRNISQVSATEIENWLIEHQDGIETLVTAISTLGQPSSETQQQPAKIKGELHPPQIQELARDTTALAKNPLPVVEEKPVHVQAAPQETQNIDRVVRVSAENLNRLMGLAGESLVTANRLQPFADSLLQLRSRQVELSNLLEKLQDELRVV